MKNIDLQENNYVFFYVMSWEKQKMEVKKHNQSFVHILFKSTLHDWSEKGFIFVVV